MVMVCYGDVDVVLSPQQQGRSRHDFCLRHKNYLSSVCHRESVRRLSFRRSDDHLPFFFRALKVDLRNYRLHRTQDYRLMY